MEGRPRVSFDTVQRALTVEMISTLRSDLVTCAPEDSVAEVEDKANRGRFDHLPVEESGSIVGIFNVRPSGSYSAEEPIRRHMDPRSDRHLITADTAISDYLHEDPGPRLVVPDAGPRAFVQGLITPADTRRPAAQAALACLIIQFEVALIDRVRGKWPGDEEEWKRRLDRADDQARGRVCRWYKNAQNEKRDVGWLLETSLVDKMKILGIAEADTKCIRRLRNDIFHAKEAAQEPRLSMRPEVIFTSVQALSRVLTGIGRL